MPGPRMDRASSETISSTVRQFVCREDAVGGVVQRSARLRLVPALLVLAILAGLTPSLPAQAVSIQTLPLESAPLKTAEAPLIAQSVPDSQSQRERNPALAEPAPRSQRITVRDDRSPSAARRSRGRTRLKDPGKNPGGGTASRQRGSSRVARGAAKTSGRT